MKTFRFSLEAVRTVRQRQENEALEQYAQALLVRKQAFDALEAMDGWLGRDSAQLQKLLADGCSGATAAQAHQFHRSLEKRRDDCIAALGAAERRVNAASQKMLAARQQREIVDVYCEKQLARHQRLVLREEQKLMDEFAGRRATSFHAVSD
jgi:flagellar export protein FliJ